MTYTRYMLHRFAKAFGINRKAKRMSDITTETHLLRQAEAHLGRLIWKEVSEIDAIGHAYWNLRKLTIRHQELHERIEGCRSHLQNAQQHRASVYNNTPEAGDESTDRQRAELTAQLRAWSLERESLTDKAKAIRKRYNGAKTQLEVLEHEDGAKSREAEQVRMRLEDIKREFEDLKLHGEQLAQQIEEGDRKLTDLAPRPSELSDEERKSANIASLDLNQVNKELSLLMNEFKGLENEMHDLQSEIGKHVSRNTSDAACRKAASSQQGLVDVMGALRQSINYNRRLNGTR